MAPIRIAVDVMGADGGPSITLAGAFSALAEHADLTVTLVGDAKHIEPAVADSGAAFAARVHLEHTDEFVSQHDDLGEAVRRKPRSSMRMSLEALAGGAVQGVVSAGNTGALMALARIGLPMLPGIDRPAIVKALPGKHGPFWMLDLGANINCSPEQIEQFALMGAVMASAVGDVTTPRVALLNIGAEAGKGVDLVQRAAERLSASRAFEFVGYVEGHKLFDGVADVVVCDGFVGNVALKTSEGAADMALHLVRESIAAAPWPVRLGARLLRPFLNQLEDQFDTGRYNGASFVGQGGVVVKSHGGTGAAGFRYAVGQAYAEVRHDLPARVRERLLGVIG